VRDIARALLEVLDSGQRAALATVTRVSGSVPQQPGARLLLRSDGSLVGTVGGGAIEYTVLTALQRALEHGKTEVLSYDLTRDLGMCCGGRMELFVEAIEGVPKLWLFGAGHVAEATARLAKSVQFDVHVVDEREEWSTAARFPDCHVINRDPEAVLSDTAFTERDWLLIATHDHALDERILERCLTQPHRYIGLVGSKRKVLRLVRRISLKSGGNIASLQRVYAPVGLDLGAVSPSEIAVSIVSELVALRHGRAAPHLRLALTSLEQDEPETQEIS